MNLVECTCSCGATSFQTVGVPLFRILCHCTICQRFINAPFAAPVLPRLVSIPRSQCSDQTPKGLNPTKGSIYYLLCPSLCAFSMGN